jgi:hypothetical protein
MTMSAKAGIRYAGPYEATATRVSPDLSRDDEQPRSVLTRGSRVGSTIEVEDLAPVEGEDLAPEKRATTSLPTRKKA